MNKRIFWNKVLVWLSFVGVLFTLSVLGTMDIFYQNLILFIFYCGFCVLFGWSFGNYENVLVYETQKTLINDVIKKIQERENE